MGTGFNLKYAAGGNLDPIAFKILIFTVSGQDFARAIDKTAIMPRWSSSSFLWLVEVISHQVTGRMEPILKVP